VTAAAGRCDGLVKGETPRRGRIDPFKVEFYMHIPGRRRAKAAREGLAIVESGFGFGLQYQPYKAAAGWCGAISHLTTHLSSRPTGGLWRNSHAS